MMTDAFISQQIDYSPPAPCFFSSAATLAYLSLSTPSYQRRAFVYGPGFTYLFFRMNSNV